VTLLKILGTPLFRRPMHWHLIAGFIPRSHYESRRALRQVEEKVPELTRLGIHDRYAARSRLLHGEVFCEGVLDPDLLEIEIDKVLEFIEIVRNQIQRT